MRAFSTRHPLSTRAKAMGNRPQVGPQLSYKLTRVLNISTSAPCARGGTVPAMPDEWHQMLEDSLTLGQVVD